MRAGDGNRTHVLSLGKPIEGASVTSGQAEKSSSTPFPLSRWYWLLAPACRGLLHEMHPNQPVARCYTQRGRFSAMQLEDSENSAVRGRWGLSEACATRGPNQAEKRWDRPGANEVGTKPPSSTAKIRRSEGCLSVRYWLRVRPSVAGPATLAMAKGTARARTVAALAPSLSGGRTLDPMRSRGVAPGCTDPLRQHRPRISMSLDRSLPAP